jgi:Zn-dependent protease with chaperone function
VMPASAQNVRWENSGYASTRRQGDNAADKQNRTDWPRIADGDAGTQVHVSFDLRNADVVLMTGGAFGQQPLLAQARQIAPRIDCPRADYILFTGTKTVTTDIELNKYLVRPDKNHTQSDLDLSALAAALNASSLPRPIVIFVNADDADTATLTAAGATKNLGEATFFGLNEVPPGARLHFAASVPWYAPLVGLVLAVIFLHLLYILTTAPWRLAKKRREQAGQSQPTAPLTPEEVQKRYDKQKPVWLITSLFPMAVVLLTVLGNPRHLMAAVMYSLPFDLTPQTMVILPLVMFGPVALSALVCTLVERRQAKRIGIALPASIADPDAPPAWTQRWFLGVMMAMVIPMLFLPPLLFGGLLHHITWLRFLPFVMLGLMAVALIGGGWFSARATRMTLSPDDPWYVMVHEVAAQAGVKVRHVVRVQSPAVNAYASIFGTVGLTAGLLRKMEPDEIRVVIAHEIGHFRGGHVRRSFVVSFLALAAFWALWWSGLHAAKSHLSEFAYNALNGPMISVFLVPVLMNLLLGRGRRRREAEADLFAVEAAGDPELVIATLTKLHTLNASPHRLKPSDELLSSHPSLVNRIETIRRNSGLPGRTTESSVPS